MRALQVLARDREVLDGALGLGAVLRVRGHPHLAHRVVLGAELGRGGGLGGRGHGTALLSIGDPRGTARGLYGGSGGVGADIPRGAARGSARPGGTGPGGTDTGRGAPVPVPPGPPVSRVPGPVRGCS
nr:hypothetical protein [Streptomyces sp. NEAU-H3]